MLFNSIAFLFFVPIVFMLYWFVFNRSVKQSNAWIALTSFFFYGSWDWRFLGLLLAMIAVNFVCGISIEKHARRRKILMWAGVLFNLSLLFIFKYFDFFSLSLARLASFVGIDLGTVTLSLVLPVGISFFTFQAIAYIVDVYRRDVKPSTDIVAFSAFLSFFPQLVAGPIERASSLLSQFNVKRIFDNKAASIGCRLILWGLFKKVVIADNCGADVDLIFRFWDDFTSITLLAGAVLYAFQIYCDFSGYSDIAIGVASLFGIRLSRNFAMPYLSRSVPEFWRRWHISLTSWFRDYVYIPMGGGRKGKAKKMRNILSVFLLSGLWHGASMSFIAWGGVHAVAQTPDVVRGKRVETSPPRWKHLWKIALTFALIVFAWIPFRAQSLSDAAGYVERIFTVGGPLMVDIYPSVGWCLLLMACEWFTRSKSFPLDFSGSVIANHRWMRWSIYYLLILCVIIYGNTTEQFIYFQF